MGIDMSTKATLDYRSLDLRLLDFHYHRYHECVDCRVHQSWCVGILRGTRFSREYEVLHRIEPKQSNAQ